MDIKIAQQEAITELVLENQKLKRELNGLNSKKSEQINFLIEIRKQRDEITEKYEKLVVDNMLEVNKLYNEIQKTKNALLEVVEQTDGRNASHIGQDRAYSIALEATK
jgi:hypothetical protein